MNIWTEEEINILKNNYKTMYDKDLAKLIPNHSLSSIATKRKDLGLHHDNPFRKKYTFSDVVNEIQKRGYELISDSSEYVNAAEQTIRYICPKHRDVGIQYTSLGHLKEGKGCWHCGLERTVNSKTKDLHDFESSAKSMCDQCDFEYIGVDRLNINGKNKVCIKFICNKHRAIGVQHMTYHNMFRDNVTSCKYCVDNKKYKFSYGEKAIKLFLDKNNYMYIQQYCFDDCRDKTYLPFDFYIPHKNAIVEYDGQHHYYPINFNGMDNNEAESCWISTITHDQIKNDYCTKNNIKLIRIPFWEQKNIDSILYEELIA